MNRVVGILARLLLIALFAPVGMNLISEHSQPVDAASPLATEIKLLASDGAAGDSLGACVSISGDTIVVGVPNDDDLGSDSGSAYVFARNQGGANNWGQLKKLTASDGARYDLFGVAVSISGDTIVVGAYMDDDMGSESGSAYVFARNQGGANNWGEVKKLTATDAAASDGFGCAVSISDDTIVVGAYGDDDLGSDSGSAYVFARNQGGTNNWGQFKKLTATDGVLGEQFGDAVSISGDTIVVGAPAGGKGSAYVFARNQGGTNNWGQVKKLTATDGAGHDWFGGAVSISSDTVVVGAVDDDDKGTDSGSAYVFARNQGGPDNWGQLKKLTATDGAGDDRFGCAVSISGDTIVVGAYGDDDMGSESGSAYVFARNQGGANNWGQVKKLTAADGAAKDLFGLAVSISGDTIVAGAYGDDDMGSSSGSAYVFRIQSAVGVTLVTVELKDSHGVGLSGGVVEYYSGGWQSLGTTDANGKITKDIPSGTYSFRMTYGGARQEKSQNVAANATAVFQTNLVAVQLKDHNGNPIDTGTVQYYAGGWKTFGSGSTSGGQVTMELLPLTYSFGITYGGARQEKSQNVAANATAVFQTNLVAVQLKDHNGNPIDTGTVQYYAGGWKTFGSGSTSGGQVTMELLPLTYSFGITYGGARQEKSQNVAANATAVFQTNLVAVQLKDHNGNPIDTGTVQYYAGGWKTFGSGSTSGGQVTMELLPLTYSFGITYGGARQEKSQNVAANATAVFQTNLVAVQLKDHNGNPIDTGTVQYYAGGWKTFGSGSTSGGQVTMELLPLTYSFGITYGGARQEKSQNVAANATAVFQTNLVAVQLKDHNGNPIDTGTVQYYAGGWKTFGSGSTSGGQVTMELLPLTYSFGITYGGARQEKSQNVAANATVVFQTGSVRSDSATCTQYYANGWRVFTNDMELLPVSFAFHFNDGTSNTTYTIVPATVKHIH